MADLTGPQAPTTSGGSGRGRSNGGSRAAGPVPVPQYSASGVPGPREVWRNRQAREARRREEIEQREKEQQEEENQRKAQEDRRRRSSAAGAAAMGEEESRPTSVRLPAGVRVPGSQGGERRQGERVSSGGATRANAPNFEPSAPGESTYDRARDRPSEPRAAAPPVGGASARAPSGGQFQQPAPSQQEPSNASQQHRGPGQTSQSRPPTGTGGGRSSQAQQGPSAAPSTSQPTQTGPSAENARQRTANVSSFPHAFERWETLSSHWEGLTSYWIRRLEQNSDENSREPLAQQMSRQITDLSAAGANLFHAVVELQRLRASSERKFQRWFLDTRQEQERTREEKGELEALIRRERRQRTDTVQNVSQLEKDKLNAEKMVSEMRRELQISKEEARRAWEELGRREQEERERTISLRDGQPTLVGGVQVVPMQGGPSRHGSVNRPTTREGPYPGGPGRSALGGQDDPGQSPTDSQEQYGESEPSRHSAGDPFLESAGSMGNQALHHEPDLPALPHGQIPATNGAASSSRSRTGGASYQQHEAAPGSATGTSAPGSRPTAASAPFYQHQGSSIQGPGQVGQHEGASDDATLSEEEQEYEIDEHGELRLDAQGRPIMYRPGLPSDASDEYEYTGQGPGSRPARGGPAGGGWSGDPADHPDYSGSGFGAGWESLQRHHHPTRLSDVLEEDERSRTSPSRASQTSRR
ncbi:MAG: hypothetical protein M1833_003133 [Piccolia ochrophora]|nr:MAG: hypothetical protein M1833_003133 [Piccolia ochrophora]